MDQQPDVKLPEKKQPEQQKTNAEAAKPEEKKSESDGEDTPEKINWKKFREQREIERKEKIASEKKATEKAAEVEALKAAMEALVNKPQQSQQQTDTPDESEEQRVNRLVKAAVEQRDRDHEELRRKRDQAEAPQRILKDYPDWNQICSPENLDYLDYHFPEITAPFSYMPAGYEKWAAMYKATKKLIPNPTSQRDERKAEKNTIKPQSMSIGGTSPTGDHAPHKTDQSRYASNWARMQKTLKGI